MYQHIIKELLAKGFFGSNGILSKFVQGRQYLVREDQGQIWVETTFSGNEREKKELLDSLRSLTRRYALTEVRFKDDQVEAHLTRPGSNAPLEAARIDYLTQSIETAIRNLEDRRPKEEITVKKAKVAAKRSDFDIRDRDEEDPFAIKTDRVRRHSHHSYIPPETNPKDGDGPYPVVTSLIDRRFSSVGFAGAVLGALLGSVVMAAVHTFGVPAQMVGFLVPVLVIGIYRVMAGRQMNVALGVVLVLASLLGGSVLISAIEVLKQTDAGVLRALRQGIAAHYNNKAFFVGSVWASYGLSVLAASIPTMLLLSGGKKRPAAAKK